MSKKQKTHKRPNFWWLVVAAIAVLCLPAILNRPTIFGIEALDFSNSGQIGDTIGGITAPFFNLIAAVLIYLSFKEQTKANEYFVRSSKIEKEHDLLFHLIENLDSRIGAFEHRLTTNHSDGQKTTTITTIYSGIGGIQFYTNYLHMNDARVAKQLVNDLNKYPHGDDAPYTLPCYSDVYQIIRLIEFIASKISKADFRIDHTEKDEVKVSLFERLDITYSTSLQHSIDTFTEAFDKAGYNHTSFEEIKKSHQKYKEVRANILTSS